MSKICETHSKTLRVSSVGRPEDEGRRAGVTVISVSPGNVFAAHISLGMHVSPHIYP